MTLSTYEADDFSLDITVMEGGSAKDIAGATVEALVSRGSSTIAATASLADAANGIIRVRMDEDTLSFGLWSLQVRVTIGTETQTVYADEISVKKSLSAA